MTSTKAVRKWRKLNPLRQKEHQAKQYAYRNTIEFKLKNNEYMKRWRAKNRDLINARERESYSYGTRHERYLRDKDKMEFKRKEKDKLKKQAIMGYYSKGEFICACCGYADNIHFYAIDHVKGGGNKHKKERQLTSLYDWLIRNNMPEGFQVLCHNCNMAKKINNGVCPHNI